MIRGRAVKLLDEIESARRRGAGRDLRFRIVGHIDGHYSLAGVNRGLVVGLHENSNDVIVNHYHGAQVPGIPHDMHPGQHAIIAPRIQPWEETSADDAQRVSVTHHYPLIADNRPALLKLAFFFWEESIVPASHVDHLNKNFSGIMVATEFVRKALRDSGCTLPIRVVPLGVDPVLDTPASELESAPRKGVRFLHVSSVFPRKGIDTLLDAFFAEFSADDDVELLIKTFPNPHNDLAEQIERRRLRHPRPPQIVVEERTLAEGEMVALYRGADVVVLPTRGEGFNLPAAEAMALGVPVIATGYGAQADFVTPETGWCLDFDYAPAKSHLATGASLWLDPDVNGLKALLRRFASEKSDARFQSEVRTKARLGQGVVRSVYRWANTGLLVREFAADILAGPARENDAPLRLAVVSSWACRCGVGEYTRYLMDCFRPDKFTLTHYCDTRTAAAENVLPTWAIGVTDSFEYTTEKIMARRFDAIVVQHQPSLFDIFAAAPSLLRLQRQAPVFLTLHSTDFLKEVERERLDVLAGFLQNLERIFVHSLRDMRNLKDAGLVANVARMPHGVPQTAQGHVQETNAAQHRGNLCQRLDAGGFRSLPAERQTRLASAFRDGDFWIGTFGFLLPHKGFDELLDALSLLHLTGMKRVRMLMLCSTLDKRSADAGKRLWGKIDKLGLKDAVVLITDFMNEQEIAPFLNSMDINVFAYQNTMESASGAVSQAIATMRPILVTPIPIFDELRSFAFTSAGIDPASVADSLAKLARDRGFLESRLERQAAWLQDRRWPRISNLLAAMIQGIIQEQRHVSPRGETTTAAVLSAGAGARNDISTPPGLLRPATGAGKAWLARTFRLASVADGEPPAGGRSAEGETVFWNPSDYALHVTGDQTETALHLAPRLRTALTESLLRIPGAALRRFDLHHQTALFLYAIRHGLRTVVEDDGGLLSEVCAFADVIVSDDIRTLTDAQKPRLGVEAPQMPNLRPKTWLNGSAITSERAMLRPISSIGFESSKDPIAGVIRSLGGADEKVAHPSTNKLSASKSSAVKSAASKSASPVNRRSGGWTLVSADASDDMLESVVASASPLRNRVALVIAAGWASSAANRNEAARTWFMDHAFAFIFTSRAAYEDFFALIATEARSVSLLRRRAYVLDEAMDVETAGDNLARILRRARSLRLSDFEDTLPTLKSPPARCRKRLSVCVSTFNRAQWLLATLPLLAEETRGRGDIELLIVDNTSTDETPFVIGEIVERYGIRLVRNPSNVGMLGNLAVTAVNAEGDYVWILGDDDIVVPGTIEKIMRMLQEFPSSELIYLNYAYTHFDRPVDLTDSTTLIAGATPIAPMTPNGYFDRIRDFAANNENLFTAIYACVFRRDHAIAAYTQYTGGMPFSTMAACIPTTKYVLEQMMDRPGCWIGSHQLVVNMNVSWMRYAAVWHMERLPEAFDLAEREGADPTKLMKYRRSNLTQAVHFMRQGYTEDQDIRGMLSFARYLENAKRIPDLPRHAAELFLEYDMATAAQSKDEGLATTGSLRTMYGLLDQ